jgi:UDP-N-acetylmuramoyl-tripeptide--D-alanyl-D-alanine ligase
MLSLDLAASDSSADIFALDKTTHRQTLINSDLGHKIIDNSFNSNPMGIEHSLKLIAEEGNESSIKYLVTPGMIELGGDQFSLNYAFGTEASKVINSAFVPNA